MSLVAYGASDSETSDAEVEAEVEEHNDTEELSVKENNEREDHISDEEDYQTVTSSSSTIFSNYSSDPANKVENLLSSNVSSSSVSSQALPPPQKREEINVEETELEEEVRQKPAELADAPKPPPKRTKQPVKITIPSLSEIADEEDDTDSKKTKPVESSVRSGLFALLPSPIHSAKKEINRPLIPHSLGKKTATPAPKPVVQAKSISSSSSSNQAENIAATAKSNITDSKSNQSFNKNSSAYNALTGYDSDDDDNDDSPSNFFSLNSESKETDSVSSTTNNGASSSKASSSKSDEKQDSLNSDERSETAVSTEAEEAVSLPEPGLVNDSPLDFGNASKFSSWSSASSSYLGGYRPNLQAHPSNVYNSVYPQSCDQQSSSVQYNMVDVDEADIASQIPPDELQEFMNDKEFQRLHGKRKRGMDEAINFVDAKVDDYVDPSELSKHITEESEYSSKKNKDDMPTSQQKRKKQITYLAFQAKEKELELKNTWSQNKMTRRQTQAKYGF